MIKCKRGNIFMCDLGYGYQSEQGGRRPCIVMSNDKANTFSPVITVVPLTTKNKKKLPTHCEINATGFKSIALCEQVTSISKDKLLDYIGECNSKELLNINKAIKIQLDL